MKKSSHIIASLALAFCAIETKAQLPNDNIVPKGAFTDLNIVNSLNVNGKITTERITSLDGKIHFGDHSIVLDHVNNIINADQLGPLGTPIPANLTIQSFLFSPMPPATVNTFINPGIGNVGIGTTTPKDKLEVIGSFSSTSVATGSVATGTINVASLSGGGMVVSNTNGDLSNQAIPPDMDNQTLSIIGSTLSISGGNSVVLPPSTGDNLGNHIATSTLTMSGLPINGVGYLTFSNGGSINPSSGQDLSTGTLTRLGIKTIPSYDLDVYGDINYSGTLYNSSDRRFKKNTTTLSSSLGSSLQKVLNLNSVTYLYDREKFPERGFNNKQQFGFIAQEVEEIFPNLVSLDRNGYYSLNYIGLIPVLVDAIKEQQDQINAMKAIVSNCCSNGGKTMNDVPSMDVELSSNSAILFQNMPNPFGDGTIIRYFVPANSAGASIIFYDEFGNEIKNAELPSKGQTAELNLSTVNLAAGIYSYSLVVNGKTVDTKKMVKTK